MAETDFDECFRQHYPRLVALGQVMTRDADAARDLAQETFVRLHRNWSTVRTYDNPGGWLRRVMSNLLIDDHRSRQAERQAVTRLGSRPEPVANAGVRVDDDWSTLVASLPARQRLIVTLHYGDDQSVADIAEMLDISPNTVKSALAKARATLRETWEEQ